MFSKFLKYNLLPSSKKKVNFCLAKKIGLARKLISFVAIYCVNGTDLFRSICDLKKSSSIYDLQVGYMLPSKFISIRLSMLDLKISSFFRLVNT